jgi:hypothetical protein
VDNLVLWSDRLLPGNDVDGWMAAANRRIRSAPHAQRQGLVRCPRFVKVDGSRRRCLHEVDPRKRRCEIHGAF